MSLLVYRLCAKRYCGTIYNTSLCLVTKAVGGAKCYISLMLDYHSLIRSAETPDIALMLWTCL